MWVRLAQLLLEDLKYEFGAVLTDGNIAVPGHDGTWLGF